MAVPVAVPVAMAVHVPVDAEAVLVVVTDNDDLWSVMIINLFVLVVKSYNESDDMLDFIKELTYDIPRHTVFCCTIMHPWNFFGCLHATT